MVPAAILVGSTLNVLREGTAYFIVHFENDGELVEREGRLGKEIGKDEGVLRKKTKFNLDAQHKL